MDLAVAEQSREYVCKLIDTIQIMYTLQTPFFVPSALWFYGDASRYSQVETVSAILELENEKLYLKA